MSLKCLECGLNLETGSTFRDSKLVQSTNRKFSSKSPPARNIQIYDSELLITATLSGLRYYMIYWPVTSAVVGISIIFFFLSLLSVLTFYKLIFNINDETDDELTEELLKETYKDEVYKDEGFSYSEADTMNNLD